METENKPFAPFGALFHQLLSQKIQFNYSPFFFVGKYAYEEAKQSVQSGQLALCLPYGHAFETYAWPVQDLKIILFDTGGMSSLGLSKLTYNVLKRGAKVVAIYSEQKRSTDVFTLMVKKEVTHGKGARR